MNERPSLTPLVRSLPATVPFVGPEAQERERGRKFRARIGANEKQVRPVAPGHRGDARAAARENWKYCDPENHDLKQALPRHHQASRPLTSWSARGSTDCSAGACACSWRPGRRSSTSLGAYPTFNFHVAGFGGRLVTDALCE